MPGRVGMVSGLFFGLAFGMGGVGAAVLGVAADWTSIVFVYQICECRSGAPGGVGASRRRLRRLRKLLCGVARRAAVLCRHGSD